MRERLDLNVFISFVRNNRSPVERLAKALREYNISVWLERDQIPDDGNWRRALRNAIRQGTYFIACFSKQYKFRNKSRMNEELMEAIEELGQRPLEQSWFIPVVLNKCTVPDWRIGSGASLLSLEWVDLWQDWGKGIQSIVRAIDPAYKPIVK